MILSIEIDFAPNRLSDANLANAYELALPLVSRDVDQKQRRKKRVREEDQQITLVAING